ncbi:MAG: SRPBCC domain-containing protein [Candidatus Zixiibacteriota bacterium]
MTAKAKPYDWTQFTVKIEIAAPPSRVFHAWTDETVIVKWFVEKAKIEPRKGGRFYLEWLGGVHGDERILDIRDQRYLRFPFGGKQVQVEVKIKKDKKGSICEVRQFQMETTPKAKVEWHMGCKNGWVFFLANLKAYLEHGVDLRTHNPRRSYKQDFVNS